MVQSDTQVQVEDRLEQWALLWHELQDLGLGYPESIFGRIEELGLVGAAIHQTGTRNELAHIPEHVFETDAAIASLPNHLRIIIEALWLSRRHDRYDPKLKHATEERMAKRLRLSYTTWRTRKQLAYHWIAARLA